MSTFAPRSHGVLIAEDHRLVAGCLGQLISSSRRYHVTDYVSDGLEVVPACRRTAPDLLLLDLEMPGLHGLDILRMLARWQCPQNVLVLSSHDGLPLVRQALQLGALGFLRKHSPHARLLPAMDRVMSGLRFIDPDLDLPEGGTDAQTLLTPREQQVLRLIGEGRRNREIAALLFISLKTVETHRQNLMRKLGAHNVAALLARARQLGQY